MKEFFYMIWGMPAISFLFGMSCLCACVWSVRYMRYKEFEERRRLRRDESKPNAKPPKGWIPKVELSTERCKPPKSE